MAQPITAAKGQINICLEQLNNQGMQQLLMNAAAAASMSLTTQPVTSAVQGARLVVWVMFAPQAGTMTFTLTGLDINGNAVSEGPITVPAPNAAAQNAVVGKFEYETTHIFKSVNASGLTTTNAVSTGALLSVFAIQAGKFLTPGVLKSKKMLEKFSPNEHRNLLDKDTKRMQTRNVVTLDEFSQTVYPEGSLWVAYMVTGSVPTVTTVPVSPTSKLAATAVSGSPLSLTTQPVAPGEKLILVITGSSAVGSIALTGTDQYGNTGVTETITMNGNGTNGNGTYYSANVYSAINASGVVVTGLTSGSVAITGVFGWKYVFLPGDVVYSAAFEKYNGVDSFSLPWCMIDEATFSFDMQKEFALTTKGIAQDRIVIGDRTASILNANRVTAIGQPTDLPLTGWISTVYFDTSVGAIGTSQFGDLETGKFTFKSPQVPKWTATNTQNFSRVNRGKRETTFDGTVDLTNVLQLEQYRLNNLQYLTFQFAGQAIGGGNQKQWQFTFPARWDDFDIVSTPDKESVQVTVKSTAEYDPNLGGAYQLTIICQMPPTYAS